MYMCIHTYIQVVIFMCIYEEMKNLKEMLEEKGIRKSEKEEL